MRSAVLKPIPAPCLATLPELAPAGRSGSTPWDNRRASRRQGRKPPVSISSESPPVSLIIIFVRHPPPNGFSLTFLGRLGSARRDGFGPAPAACHSRRPDQHPQGLAQRPSSG